MNKAFYLGVLALGLGIFFNVLFYKHDLGLNLVLASGSFLIITYLAMHLGGHKLPRRAHIAAVFALLLSVPFAVWTSELALFVAWVGFLAAHLLFVAFALGNDAHFSHPLQVLWSGTGDVGVKLLGRIGFLQKIKVPKLSNHNWAALKGIAVLIPLLIVFIILFAQADAVFDSYLGDFSDWLKEWFKAEDLIAQILLIGFFSLTFVLFLAAAAYERYAHTPRTERAVSWIMESKIVLGGVTILFAVFLAVQAWVMFGGSAAFAEMNLTYSEYARQGFNQLIAVSIIVALVVLTLRHQHGAKSDAILTFLHAVLIAETLLVLVSAVMRLGLYVDAYGYTDTRLLAYWGALTIGLLLCLLLANVLQRESQVVLMQRALVVLGITAVLFSWSGPEALANRLNDQRDDSAYSFSPHTLLFEISPEGLPSYLTALQLQTSDSVWKMVNTGQTILTPKPSLEAYCTAFATKPNSTRANSWTYVYTDTTNTNIREDAYSRLELLNALNSRREKLSDPTWQEWNVSRARAYASLTDLDLPVLENPDFEHDYPNACAGVAVPPPPSTIVPNVNKNRVR